MTRLVVPDAIHHTDTSESLEYITGWNDCRAAMLAERPAPVQEPCGWQFFHLGKWHNGMETNGHRAITKAAGVPIRDVYPFPQAQPAQQEPVAWLFQHEETGLTQCVDTQQVEWGFEKNNPRWQKIAPLYTSPQAQRKPLTEPEKQQLAENWFAEDWAITKAIGMMFDHERLLGIKENQS